MLNKQKTYLVYKLCCIVVSIGRLIFTNSISRSIDILNSIAHSTSDCEFLTSLVSSLSGAWKFSSFSLIEFHSGMGIWALVVVLPVCFRPGSSPIISYQYGIIRSLSLPLLIWLTNVKIVCAYWSDQDFAAHDWELYSSGSGLVQHRIKLV